MRDLFSGLFLAACLFPVAVGGMQLSSTFAEARAPRPFLNPDSEPLWKSEVKRIGLSRQAYERAPENPFTDTSVATAEATRVRVSFNGSETPVSTGRHDNGVGEPPVGAERETAAREWCRARYRSYDASDNSYKPFGVSERRPCNAPSEIGSTSGRADVTIEVDANARWCMARYSSYCVEDNTYQPYAGGRKRCIGPGTESASNVQATAQDPVAQF